MIKLRTKSISYKFISLDCDIYHNEADDEILVTRHVCSDCYTNWYMNLSECFFCGSLNPFLYFCINCEKYSAITGGKIKCLNCGIKRKKICFNETCISNSDNFFTKLNDHENGVMDRKSPSSISQSHCLSCGSANNKYLTSFIKLKEINNIDEINITDDCKSYDRIIYLKVNKEEYVVVNPHKIKENLNFSSNIDINSIFL